MTVGFIGLGNMATAIIGGMLKEQVVEPKDIIGYAKTEETRQRASLTFDIKIAIDNMEVAEESDILFLAIKPQMFDKVLPDIKDSVKKDAIVVSIAAGKNIAYLESHFNEGTKIVRCMPNTPALVGEGCTGVCINEEILPEDLKAVMDILNCFGKAELVSESMMDAVVAVSGSAPAYVFMLIEAMADGAVKAGLPRDKAYAFAAQTVLGSAKMVLETGKHPAELKDMVCSPGGTTIEAVKVLEERGLRAAIVDAMDACVRRNREL
ncbi:MAG: pyrroline-5-carboxylate reductase [Lachnospiraceae bacterium]|nr:pyrroline-5-carboxylate reductase [Lachnospiraceae bacterium]MBR5943883.1 pyrroline-5-carboxylate reductase [Lachnospiraceae bacterium]